MSAVIDSIQIGRTRLYQSDNGESWESAIAKSPVTGPIAVQAEKLAGDEQADRVHHGGPDKAILVYASDHFDAWRRELPEWRVAGGTFGENLTVKGITESDVCIGDVYRVGSSLLQVSQPRQPCWKLSRKWDNPKLAAQVQNTGRTGWYLRVLETGEIDSGEEMKLTERPHPELSVLRAHEIMHAKPRCSEDDLMLARCEFLSLSWREQLETRATKGKVESQAARLCGVDDSTPDTSSHAKENENDG